MLDMCRSIISLSKIANQIWRDQPFSQRYKTTERAVGGVGGDGRVWIVGGEREKRGEGVGQSLKTGRFLSGYLGGFQMFEYNFFRN